MSTPQVALATPLHRLLWRVVKVESAEVPAVLAAFAYLFSLFTGYMMLRPVRETMGITSGVENLPALFWGTFVAMLLVQPVYSWLVSRYRRTTFLPWVYGFFIVDLLGFYVWFEVQQDHTWIARAFFIWISVFNLFVVSVFWSFMADIFKRDQAKRLYGFIAAGASAGGLVGPFLAATLAPVIGSINLLLLSALLLFLSVLCVRYLTRWHSMHASVDEAESDRPDVNRPVGGNVWSGIYLLFTDRYIMGVGLFVFFLTWISTFLYLQQAELVSHVFATPDQRTQVFGWVDFAVQTLSLLTQVFALSHLASKYGLRVMLVSIPVLMVAVFVGLALLPTLAMLLTAMIIRRVGEYAITRPCREMLFTVVDRETKYKAKNVVDTLVYRTGDAVSASLHQVLGWLGLATSGIAWAGAVIAAIWGAIAYGVGNRFESVRGNRDVGPMA